ncbi:MAG: glycosyltransferase family 4 protein [Candidatus Fervidibacter sp.]|uniref:glycosyltransferase family 4 protein n=1 Tax=Candidatus Fervidibacter sp. TaxID=3100871 RepID=UPI004049047E
MELGGLLKMFLGSIVCEFTIALLVAVCFTPIVRRGALALGWEHSPDPKKWKHRPNLHTSRIALGGGLAIFAGFVVAVTFSLSSSPETEKALQSSLFILLFPFCVMVLGLHDDLRSPRPIFRLSIQTVFGLATVSFIGSVKGLPFWLSVPITVLAVVGLMNSVNMMDNMDGVASGLMTLTMLGYAFLGHLTSNHDLTVLSTAVMGASLGFWLYNRPPATIFMGDTGSLLLGYLLAVVGTIATWGEYPSWFNRLIAPLTLASVFITDTTFVVLYRWRHGLPIMQGDRNHISHRLAVLWGYSEWKANLTLYALQALSIMVSLCTAISPLSISVVLAIGMVAILVAVGFRLWHIPMSVQQRT